ncbi:unnamed protein product [Ixodes pacificus]
MRKCVPSADSLAYAFACAECKSKPLSLLGGLMRRTASLDAIYLSAQWPRDLHSYCGRPMVDRATQVGAHQPRRFAFCVSSRGYPLSELFLGRQKGPLERQRGCKRSLALNSLQQTSDDWKEVDRIKYVQKKTTLASGDSLEMKASLPACYIRQRLQRTATQGGRTSPRWSPVQGDHQLGGLAQQQQAHLASPSTSPFAAPGNPTGPISIPARSGPGRGSALPRMRSSVEGLNQASGSKHEIERLVLKGISGAGTENEAELERVMGPTPEGHRAPIAELFHSTCSVDTQTPSGSEGLPNSASFHGTSRPDSPDCDKSGSPEPDAGGGQLSKLGTSPRINKFLAREPPDGCEKVKIIDEGRKHTTVPMAGDASDSISKPNSQFVLRPSQRSAFCPLVRNPFQGVQRAPPGTDPFLLNERLQ